jgi:molecular chaperone Hsp33
VESEQIPTAFRLGIDFDREGNVAGAGGLFLQALPAADDALARDLEDRVHALPPIGAEFGRNRDPKRLVNTRLGEFSPVFTDDTRVEFMCHCNRERLRVLLTMLPADELRDIAENGPFPVELRCHFCNTRYEFRRESIRRIYGQRYPDN